MRQTIWTLALLLALAMPAAAQDFTLWSSQTFEDTDLDPVDNAVISSIINNSGGLESVEVVVDFETLVPDRNTASADYQIFVVVETRACSTCAWHPVAQDFDGVNNTQLNAQQVIRVITGLPEIEVVQTFSRGGVQITKVTSSIGTIGSDLRVCLIVQDNGPAVFQSMTVSGSGFRF